MFWYYLETCFLFYYNSDFLLNQHPCHSLTRVEKNPTTKRRPLFANFQVLYSHDHNTINRTFFPLAEYCLNLSKVPLAGGQISNNGCF